MAPTPEHDCQGVWVGMRLGKVSGLLSPGLPQARRKGAEVASAASILLQCTQLGRDSCGAGIHEGTSKRPQAQRLASDEFHLPQLRQTGTVTSFGSLKTSSISDSALHVVPESSRLFELHRWQLIHRQPPLEMIGEF